MLKKAALSCTLWYMYVPHLWLIRRLGPKWGARAARVSAAFHWLLTWLGAQRSAARNLNLVRSELESPPPTSVLLWRRLANKHRCFVESQVAATPAGRAGLWNDVVVDNLSVWEQASQRGAILLIHHFGSYQAALVHLATMGYEIHRVRLISQVYQDSAAPWMAQLAQKVKHSHSANCGVAAIQLGTGGVMTQLQEHLQRGGLLSIAADGLRASRMTSIPFLGRKMQFPTGWAYLAAVCHKPVVPVFAFVDGEGCKRIQFHDPIHCHCTSETAIGEAVETAAGLLEQRVRRQPWDWHPWHRLQLGRPTGV